MASSLTALFIGDVVGQVGMRAVLGELGGIIERYSVDLTVVNGENANNGFGITPQQASELFIAGAQVITTGNHVWRCIEIYEHLEREERLLRPANYPASNPGHGSCVIDVKGTPIAVFNLQGRRRLSTIDCPFRTVTEMMRALPNEVCGLLIDFHAEDTAEKEAFGYYVDGMASAVIGSHTHVQTADERILPGGTAYITDMGACCSPHSVIGFDVEISIARVISRIPLKIMPAEQSAAIRGVVVKIDTATQRATHIERIDELSPVFSR